MLPGLLILACWVLLILYWNISARSSKFSRGRAAKAWASRLARVPVWLGYILLVAAWVHPFAHGDCPGIPSSQHILGLRFVQRDSSWLSGHAKRWEAIGAERWSS